jgi:hypothetical protein
MSIFFSLGENTKGVYVAEFKPTKWRWGVWGVEGLHEHPFYMSLIAGKLLFINP